jgi:hypothetical protein
MTNEQATPAGADATLTAGMLLAYQSLGPYTTLQEATARLSRNPLGIITDEAGHPLTVVTRDTLVALLGGGKDADRARGRMGARQAARERREGTDSARTLLSLRDELPPLVSAAVGTPLAEVAAQVRAGGAVGVLGTQDGKVIGVLPSRTLLRRVPEPAPTEATPAAAEPDETPAPKSNAKKPPGD